MKRPVLYCCSTLFVGSLAYFIYAHKTEADPYEAFTKWPPATATIQQSLASLIVPTGGNKETAQRDEFAHMFQSRFRNHEPMMAIGLKFTNTNRIKLMCPARMEPWNVDQLALSAWKDSRAVLGKSYDVDIFETYIGTAPIKIGELRSLPDRPEVASIHYIYHKPHYAVSTSPVLPPGEDKSSPANKLSASSRHE